LDKNNVLSAIFDELKSEDNIKLSLEIAELGVDKFLDNDFFQSIPFLKIVYSIYKGSINISDRLLFFKVTKFLYSLKNHNIPFEKRIKFLDKMNSSPAFKKRVSYDLLNILNKIDELDKIELITKVFRYCMLDLITYDEFTRCAYGINSAFMNDIKAFIKMNEEKETFNAVKQNLIHTGFVKIKTGNTWNDVGRIYYEITDLGTKLIQIAKSE